MDFGKLVGDAANVMAEKVAQTAERLSRPFRREIREIARHYQQEQRSGLERSSAEERGASRRGFVASAEASVPEGWRESADMPREVVSRVRDLQKEGMQRLLADPSRAREITDELGRRLVEEPIPIKTNRGEGPRSTHLSEVFHPDQLEYMRHSAKRSIASGCVQFKIGESALRRMLGNPADVEAALLRDYSEEPPGYETSTLDDDYVMHAIDGYPRAGGQHAFMQAAVKYLRQGWEDLDPIWRDVVAPIKSEMSVARDPILESIPPRFREQLDLPAHFVSDDVAGLSGDKSVISAATNMTSVQQVLRGFLGSLSENREIVSGWPWSNVQHAVMQSPQKLSVMAGVTFATLGKFTAPKAAPEFAFRFDEENQKIESIAVSGAAKDARASSRPGFCPGFQSLNPSGIQEAPTRQQKELVSKALDAPPNRNTSGSNTLMQVGSLLLPLLGRDYPELALGSPTLTARMLG